MNNCILSKDGTILIFGCRNSVIPNSVKKIENKAFYDCKELKSIDIPNSVTNIGNYAFSDCGSLTSIEIPSSVTEIGDAAFQGCDSLISIEIPDSVTEIGRYAFYGCHNLISIKIPNTIVKIGNDAFSCQLLTLRLDFENPNDAAELLTDTNLLHYKISLYVPVGTGYAYRNHEFFKDFKEIIATNVWPPKDSES